MSDAKSRGVVAGGRREFYAKRRNAAFAVFMVAVVTAITIANVALYPAMDFVPAFVLGVVIALVLNLAGQVLVRTAIERGWGGDRSWMTKADD